MTMMMNKKNTSGEPYCCYIVFVEMKTGIS